MTRYSKPHQSGHLVSLAKLSFSAHQYFALVAKQEHVKPQWFLSPGQGRKFKRFNLLLLPAIVPIYRVHPIHLNDQVHLTKQIFRLHVTQQFDLVPPAQQIDRVNPT